MNEPTTAWLAEAIHQAARSVKFCAVGCLPGADPGLVVEGLGALALPLKRGKTKPLIARCQVAPYGKGEQTLVDTKVRKTFELDPRDFRVSDAWSRAIVATLESIAKELGLPAGRLEARLYKLLVYERGGFFLRHRDSEKHDRMVASLIVALPNAFDGGTLVVRHGTETKSVPFAEAAAGQMPCYAAFYADCEHEVERVRGGVRLCLAYNLVLKQERGKSTPRGAAPDDVLVEAITTWVTSRPSRPLVFALEHHYTERGLDLDLLKGADRQLADRVLAAAAGAECLTFLAQISRHLLLDADDGSEWGGYSRRSRTGGKLQIGDTLEDEWTGSQWTDTTGKKQAWESMPLEVSSIVSSVPLEKWKPTSEEYEGYTGNAGNTLDRWYHRSALVLWHRDQHFEVVANIGTARSLPLFSSMMTQLARVPRKRLEEARGDCIRFARAIISRWRLHTVPFEKPEKALVEEFPGHLLTLNDRDTIAHFLSTLAERDRALSLKGFVVAACRAFGWNAFPEELERLLTTTDKRDREEIAARDAEWLEAVCADEATDPDRRELAQTLCAVVVERFCEKVPPRQIWDRPAREPSDSERALPLLLQALLACGRDEDLARVISFVQQSPGQFRLDVCQVPCLQSLVPWSKKKRGSVHPHVMSWLTAVRQHLETATANRPTPPRDWARPVNVKCTCSYCAQLKAFLADPWKGEGRIAAREDLRGHLTRIISEHGCDVRHTLERKGSPYSLVLTKTLGSFERALSQFEANCRLLASLPSVA